MTLPLPDANPLLEPWTGPFEAPPFDRIAPRHFEPAFEAALKEARAEIDAIAADPAPPTFANTIEAMERSGRTLDRVAKVFFNLAGAETNDELEAIERAIAPVLSRHASDTYLNDALFRRIDALKANVEALGLTPEQARALSRTHLDFTRAGAGLAPEAKARLAAIGERLAALSAAFGQNVLADERAWTLWLDEGDLDGLPDFWVASAARLAAERGHPGRYAVTLSRSSVEPFLQFSARRDLRETAFRAWGARGENGGATDNRAIAARNGASARRARETARLREPRPLPPRRHDGQDAQRRARPLGIGLDARRRRRPQGSRGVAGDRGQRGRQFPRRAVGLALSRREAPQGGVRFRRERDKALPPARPHDRGRFLRRGPAVRRDLRRAVRPAAASPRRARLDGHRP